MQSQQYQIREEKKINQNIPHVVHNVCSCGYFFSFADRFCPQCGKQNGSANVSFAYAPESETIENNQPEILSISDAEEILKTIDDEITSTNVEVILNKFEQHALFVREKKLHQINQEQFQNHYMRIKDQQYEQQEPDFLAKITKQVRVSTIKPNFNLGEIASNIQQSEKQLHQLILQKEKEMKMLINLEKQSIASEIAIMEEKKKRLEFEELQRKIKLEEERKKIETEKLLRSFSGLYSNAHNCPCGGYLHEKLNIKIEYKDGFLTGYKTYKWSPECGFKGGLYAGTIYTATLDIKINGNIIKLTEKSFGFIKNPHNLMPSDFKHNFEGTISSDGTIINGHWYDDYGNSESKYTYFKFK